MGFFGIDWVIADLVRGEIWAWDGLLVKRNIINMISLTVFWVIWKKMNSRAFDSVESSFNRIKDRWIHYFGSILLGHDINNKINFGNVIDTLTTL